tara:strand:+ start:489 stop:3308 length:2820 start_codon:yes stop_codon:yes gene_type:complete
MAGITQTIPQFSLGMSEQPDNLKFPGQVTEIVNAIPDVTKGLFKRPGAKRIGADKLSNVQSGGSWFHYFRDKTEGSYIGQIAADGQVRVWRCSDGQQMTTAYGTGGQTAITNYLTTSAPENLQFLTINDTTFVNNRDSTNANTLVGTTGTTDDTPDPHFAFVELLRTENGRQYGLNIFDSATVTTQHRATRIKIQSDNLNEEDGTGHCPGIGTQVFSVDSGSKKNLIFRLSILGQQGVSPNYDGNATQNGQNYRCSYQRDITLLHGGEGYQTGDTVQVTLTQARGGATGTVSGGIQQFDSDATYTIVVEEHESTDLNATVFNGSNGNGLIRPEPTPFDAQTAVSADQILGGIVSELPTGINAKIIGNGLYLSSQNPFNVDVVEQDLMRVMQGSVNDVQDLPNQCKNGYIVKIANSRMSQEDDYYLRFDGQNDKDGVGSWSECAKPGIPKTLTNMPLVIQRTAATTFTVKQFTYRDRRVGDEITNPLPTFVNKRINKVLFFRNRLAFLSGENVITSRPGTLGTPDFFIETALTVSTSDPVDISAASMFPSELFDGIEINTGLLVFSSNQQFLLSSDDTVFNPDTAKLRSISTFSYDTAIPPISLGTTVGYLDTSNKFTRFNEMANVAREGEPNIIEVSKVVPTLLPKDLDLITNSRENSIILISKTNTDVVFGYKYFQTADKRSQAAWFTWKLNNPLVYHFIIDDEYFFLDSDYYLQSIKLIQADNDPSIVQDNVDFLLHVDNHTTVSGGSFNATTNLTTFSGVGWLNTVTTPNHQLVVIDTNSNSSRVGRYAKATVSGTSFTLPGNWSGVTLTIGYIYPYEVKFPTLYPTKVTGGQSTSDVNSSLVIHRIKLHFGKIGLYETTLERVGKSDYTEVYESTELDEYDASDAPYLEEFVKTVPVYEKNTNVEITLKSSHPAPATLRSLSWEGDYSPKFYQRV